MSAATEFYGDILVKYTEICKYIQSGKLTMNQGYKKAQGLGFKGSLKDWIETTKNLGLIPPLPKQSEEVIIAKPKKDHLKMVMVGVLLIGGIYLITKNK
jgi:hypothetical protein